MEIDFYPDEIVYVIDTSALITLDLVFKKDNPVFTAIWDEIEDLISNGHFKILDFVEDEIKSYEGKEDFLKKWITKWNKLLIVETDIESFNAAIPIINQEYSTGFFNARKQAEGKEEADPYLLGYCMVHKCVLITSESKEKPNKLPAVARKNNIRCIDVNDFLLDRGLKMERKKNE